MHLSIEIPNSPPPSPPRAKVGICLDIITILNKPPPYWGILTGNSPPPLLVGKPMLFPN